VSLLSGVSHQKNVVKLQTSGYLIGHSLNNLRIVSDLPVIVLGTEFEKEENIYTGLLKSENCYGKEKVNRINEWATPNKIVLSVQSAWSDHFSDFDMLSLSAKRYWVGGEQLRKLIIDRDPEANFVHTEQ